MTNRRNFLIAGGLGLSAMGLPSLVESKETQKGKSVILIFLGGGISHQESFVAYPDAPEKARSVNGYVKTKSGFYLGGEFKKLAELNNFSVVHSFGHQNAGHQGGTHWNMTGYNYQDENGSAQKNPSYGSIVNRYYGATNPAGIPHYVSLSKTYGEGPAYLGNTYAPFSTSEEGKRNLLLSVDVERFNQRMYMLQQMDNKFKTGRTDKDIDGYKKQTKEILVGETSKIFDAKNEPQYIQDMYGKDDFAIKCMLARRLVENGVKFVTIHHGGWDMHQNIKEGYAQRGPNLDHGVATLLADLEQRGMLENTLVILTGEFGRTLLNKDNGRDHWPASTALLIAGKNYSGRVIGTVARDGMYPKDNPYKPVDLLNTILNHMEISPKTQYLDNSGRPRYLVEGEAKIIV